MDFHTWIAKNGGRRKEIEAGELSSEIGLFFSFFRRNHGGWRQGLAEVGRGRRPSHFGTGPVNFGGRTRARSAKTWPAVTAVAREEREREKKKKDLSNHFCQNYGYAIEDSPRRALCNGTVEIPKFLPGQKVNFKPNKTF
ncbi:unnamed protein product [Prunus armeniaca]